MTVQNGKEPDIADCTYQVMKHMADLLGLQTKLVTKGGKSCKT
jgi:hypothetical protein